VHAMPDPDVKTFWKDAAAHYAANGLVAFELFNEPHYVDDAVWLAGTSGATQTDCQPADWVPSIAIRQKNQLVYKACINNPKTVKWRAVGMQDLYDLVSTTAPRHLVVVDGPDWAGRRPRQRVNATHRNLVYGLHPYSCSDPKNTTLDCAHTEKAHANIAVLDNWRPLASTAPLLVTEVGWPAYPSGDGTRTDYTEGATFYRETIAYLRQQNPKWGIIGFAFDGLNNGTFDLVTDTTTYAPNSTAQPLYDLLRAQP